MLTSFIKAWQALPSGRCLRALTLILFAASAGLIGLRAEDGVSLKNIALSPGKVTQVPIQLNNETAYTAFQMDITLPEGVNLVQSDGATGVSLSSRATAHSLTTTMLKDGTFRVVAFSMQNEAFTGNSGDLLYLALTIDESFEGPKTIELKKIIFTTTTIKEVKFQDVFAICDKQTFIPGDVNGDGDIDIVDVTSTIGYVIHQVPANFIFEAADVNNDGTVDIVDVTSIIDMIINKSKNVKEFKSEDEGLDPQ